MTATDAPSGGRDRDRRLAATRLLAHRLFHRAETAGAEPDLDTALRLVDERLAPARKTRRSVAAEALLLCRAALVRRSAGGPLAGKLATNLRVGARRKDGAARVVLIPTLIQHPEGPVSVVAMQPAGDSRAELRARRYRKAARILFPDRGRGDAVRAFIVRPDGTLSRLSEGRTPRNAPTAAGNPGTGCSPSDRRRSGRKPR